MAKTLLIVEANPHLGYLLRRYAEESGFIARNVYETEELFGLVCRAKPAAIVLGADFPEMGRGNILCKLGTEPSTCDIPVIMCSSEQDPGIRLYEGVVAGHVDKAMTYADFVLALESAGIEP